MPEDGRSAEVKTGIFVLIALGILVFGSLWIVGSATLRGGQSEYRILMKESGGIRAGDRVRMAGVDIGRVQSVELRPYDDWPVAFRVSLDAAISLRSDGSARIASAGLLGSRFLQLQPGSREADRLDPGGDLRGETTAGLDEALGKVEVISDEVLVLMGQVRNILDQISTRMLPAVDAYERFLSPENADNLAAVLVGARTMLDASGPAISELLANLNALSSRLDEGVEELPELARKLNSLVEHLDHALGPDGGNLARLLETAEGTLGSADKALTFVDENRDDLAGAIRDLRETAGNLKQLSQQLKERPYSLVRIRSEPERRPGDGADGSKP
jgi:phospholipid/cholesterol/gamma-HCH transport system substrate-binding protein